MSDIHIPIFLGISAGCLGAFFIFFGTKSFLFRKKFINTDLKKILEAGIICFLTMTSCCILVHTVGNCNEIIPNNEDI